MTVSCAALGLNKVIQNYSGCFCGSPCDLIHHSLISFTFHLYLPVSNFLGVIPCDQKYPFFSELLQTHWVCLSFVFALDVIIFLCLFPHWVLCSLYLSQISLTENYLTKQKLKIVCVSFHTILEQSEKGTPATNTEAHTKNIK